ncbi:MAG: GspE/PulE family protein [Burkholderiaceae bacterium]|nr:GspE/PulE family protein [Burkholderiaceae bacterium]
MSPQEVRSAIEDARKRAHSRATSVLDELCLDAAAEWIRHLSHRTGVDAFVEDASITEAQPLDDRGAAVLVKTGGNGSDRLLMSDPWDEELLSAVHSRLGRYVEPVAATSAVLKRWDKGARASPRGSFTSPTDVDSTSPVVAFVDQAIARAYQEGASDVHFECDRRGVSVKLRLDGVMTPFGRLEGPQQAEESISRIKVLSQLDITERRLPQDGRFRFAGPGMGLDLRVSIMPSVFGEDAVLRLLVKSHLRSKDQKVTLDALGFDDANAKSIRWLASLPNGMLLVTGPTGSGKTTTVYAALSEINTGLEKIITIEDPVEYELPGVLQIPVNERKGLTFAKGLRSILRHDPDRILVGEIRDAETAEIAVQSALTGHLVFTTVHANSLFDVIGRFRHFGIDMFGFVSSLNGVVVQRLIRQLCPHCVGLRQATGDEAAWLHRNDRQELVESLPQVVGCEACHHTGYKGRFVIAEVHCLTDAMRDLVMRQADVSELKRFAFRNDMKTLLQRGLDQVACRRTSMEEIFRVVGQI